MKNLIITRAQLRAAGRWDIDFHLPAEKIKEFPKNLWKRVDEVAEVVRDKRDPTKEPDSVFQYIDISAVDVKVGLVANPQDLEGIEAPSRARKVVGAFDIIVSTCRPTRGAIAVVPVKLHNQIASTGFSVVRAKADINPLYLHYALRLPSTLEQFRKWSTGSSYPAMLDSDVKKTIIPVPDMKLQDEVARKISLALQERGRGIAIADKAWKKALGDIACSLGGTNGQLINSEIEDEEASMAFSKQDIDAILSELDPLTTDNSVEDGLFALTADDF